MALSERHDVPWENALARVGDLRKGRRGDVDGTRKRPAASVLDSIRMSWSPSPRRASASPLASIPRTR